MIRFANMINSPADIRNLVVYDVGVERKQRGERSGRLLPREESVFSGSLSRRTE